LVWARGAEFLASLLWMSGANHQGEAWLGVAWRGLAWLGKARRGFLSLE